MKKDTLVATFIGFILGGSVALLTINLPTIIKKTSLPISEPKTISVTPPLEKLAASSFKDIEIATPVDESIVDDKTITVSGSAKDYPFVLIETDSESDTAEVGSDGSFSKKITTHEGLNKIYVSAYGADGNETTKTVTVYYTSEKL